MRKPRDRYWTREKIIEHFVEFSILMSRAPTVADVGPGPARLAKMSGLRREECVRAKRLGLRLPQMDAVSREFGSWTAGVKAAGLTPAPCGGIRRSPSTNPRNQVCPSCGDFRHRLNEVTGWCADCTKDYRKIAA